MKLSPTHFVSKLEIPTSVTNIGVKNQKRRKATNFDIGNFTEANRFLVAKMGLSNMQWNYSAIKRSILEQLSELRAFDSNWYDNKNITNEIKGMVTKIVIAKCEIKMLNNARFMQ